MKFHVLSMLLPLLILTTEASAAGRCYALFGVEVHTNAERLSPKASQMVLNAVQTKTGNTTSKRAEDKATLSKDSFDIIFDSFRKTMQQKVAGFKMVLRDVLRDGFHNVTWTQYTQSFEVSLGKKDPQTGKPATTTGVIRMRKYGWVSTAKEVNRNNLELNPDYQSISSLEFKVRDPEFTSDQFKSVLKPIIKIHDANAQLLLSGNYSAATRIKIINETLVLNGEKPMEEVPREVTENSTVWKMLAAIEQLNVEKVPLAIAFHSLYKRSAYKIDVTDANRAKVDPNAPVSKSDVQITVDEHISTFSVEANAYSTVYQSTKPLVVVETKIPHSFIQFLSNPAASNNPLMAQGIMSLMISFRDNALKDFVIGKGKLGHTKDRINDEIKEVRNELEIDYSGEEHY